MGGGVEFATDAVGASLDDPNKDEAVSQPANPNAIQVAQMANAIGLIACLAAAESKVVTATLPR
jgi:hypothetical protein